MRILVYPCSLSRIFRRFLYKYKNSSYDSYIIVSSNFYITNSQTMQYSRVEENLINNNESIIFIPATRRVKGYVKYVTGKRKGFQLHKVCIFLISITSRVDLAMSICRMNTEVSGTKRTIMQILGLPAQVCFSRVARPL